MTKGFFRKTSSPRSEAAPASGAKRPTGKRRATAAKTKSPRAAAPRAAKGLRRPKAAAPVDLGVGPVDVAYPAGAAPSLGLAAAQAAVEKKATDVVLLDVREVSGLCDEMVLASARSAVHLNAVCDGVEEALRRKGERVLHSDGRHSAEPTWVLLDYGDVMVHVFRGDTRAGTGLEAHYADARMLAKWKND